MTPVSQPERFKPLASREMASMFDDVSGRYDLLNRFMSLGQDGAWREAMWRAVPPDALRVLDLATGSGVSLPGLKRPGRTVLAMDVSFAMLEVAQDTYGGSGWAPRFTCADGFRLPLRDEALDAITIAFGIRNFRPRVAALREIHRVLRPGGTLVVLEATAPAPGKLQPFLAFYVRHVIPLLGHLSPDPSAYRYLSESIFEFGHGPQFESDLSAAGFEVTARKSFLLGATRLWVTRSNGGVGKKPTGAPGIVQPAMAPRPGAEPPAGHEDAGAADKRTWLGLQLLVSGALTATIVYALVIWAKRHADIPLTAFQSQAGWFIIVSALGAFAIRTVWFFLRFLAARD